MISQLRFFDHHHSKAPPNVVYAQLKYIWAKGSTEDSLNFLRQFSASLAADIARETSVQTQRPGVSKEKITEFSKLVSRCYLKQGEWQVKLKDDWSQVRSSVLPTVTLQNLCSQRNIPDILRAYLLATHYDPTWYKAWHTWALANFDVIAHMEGQTEGKTADIAGDQLAVHVVQAVEGM